MTALTPYFSALCEETIRRIALFFAFHRGLREGEAEISAKNLSAAEETLANWQAEDHKLYTILFQGAPAEFLHIGFRGGNVAWIEDNLLTRRGADRASPRPQSSLPKRKFKMSRGIRRFALTWCRATKPLCTCTTDRDIPGSPC